MSASTLSWLPFALALACAQDNQPVMLYVIAPPNQHAYTPAESDLALVSHVIYDSSKTCKPSTKCELGSTPDPPQGVADLTEGVAFLRGGGTRKVLLSVGGPSMDATCWTNCWSDVAPLPVETLAGQLIDLAQSYGFDGFEIAMPPGGHDIQQGTASYAAKLVQELSQRRPAAMLTSSATATALAMYPNGNYLNKFLSNVSSALTYSALRYYGDHYATPIAPLFQLQSPNFPIVFQHLVLVLSGGAKVNADGASKAIAGFTNVKDLVAPTDTDDTVTSFKLCAQTGAARVLNQLNGLFGGNAIGASLWNNDGVINAWITAANGPSCFNNVFYGCDSESGTCTAGHGVFMNQTKCDGSCTITYKCNRTSYTCEPNKNGKQNQTLCNATCYKPTPPPTPHPTIPPTNPPTTAPSQQPPPWMIAHETLIIIGGSVGFALAGFFVFRRRRRQRGASRKSELEQPLHTPGLSWPNADGKCSYADFDFCLITQSQHPHYRPHYPPTHTLTHPTSGSTGGASWVIKPSDLVVKKGKILGSGAFSRVYKGTYHHAAVAVKELLALECFGSEQVSEAKDAMRQLMLECQVLASMHHPNIVKFYGMSTPAPSLVHIVTEFCPSDLAQAMCNPERAGHTAPLQWVEFAKQMTGALKYIHSKGVIHRDLKPANVLVAFDGGADAHPLIKLCDFGISKQTDDDPITSRTHTSMQGTPAYMAPEVTGERRSVTRYASCVDVYSLGVLFWAMWTGRTPYKSIKGTALQLLMRVTQGLRPERRFECTVDENGSTRFASVPWCLWRLLIECWHENSRMRPSTAAVMAVLEKPTFAQDLVHNTPKPTVTPRSGNSSDDSAGLDMTMGTMRSSESGHSRGESGASGDWWAGRPPSAGSEPTDGQMLRGRSGAGRPPSASSTSSGSPRGTNGSNEGSPYGMPLTKVLSSAF
jgi:serine/threonine protein kinase